VAGVENRDLGRGRVSVPVVGLGTWRRLEAAAAAGRHRELISAAVAAVIAVFDTSPMYGDAERLLAAALDGRRGQVLVAGKIWIPFAERARRNWTVRWPGTAAGPASCRSTTSFPGPRT
jgi:aryl-alcohol dehydrogenase-like predicted oxidoreductase